MLYELDGKRPEVAESAWIAPNATVLGHVRLEEEASVWFNVVLRGDNDLMRIGARSNVQDGSVMHLSCKSLLSLITLNYLNIF